MWAMSACTPSAFVFGVGDVLHPFDDASIGSFLNGDVRHASGGGCAVPVFFAGAEPDDVAGMNFFDWATGALCPTAACGNDERLAERMGVPRGARARFKGDAGAGGTSGIGWLEEWIDADRSGEPIHRSLAGCLGAGTLYVHGFLGRQRV